MEVRSPYPVNASLRVTLNLKQRNTDYSAVHIATRLLAEHRNRDSTVSRKKRLLSSPKSPDDPWKQSLSYSLEKVGGYPEVKRSGCKDITHFPLDTKYAITYCTERVLSSVYVNFFFNNANS